MKFFVFVIAIVLCLICRDGFSMSVCRPEIAGQSMKSSDRKCHTKNLGLGSFDRLPEDLKLEVLRSLSIRDLTEFSRISSEANALVMSSPSLFYLELKDLNDAMMAILAEDGIRELQPLVSEYSRMSAGLAKAIRKRMGDDPRTAHVFESNGHRIAKHIMKIVGTRSHHDSNLRTCLLFKVKDMSGISEELGLELHKRATLLQENETYSDSYVEDYSSKGPFGKFWPHEALR